MPNLLTPDDLAAIAEREAKATKGPWMLRHDGWTIRDSKGERQIAHTYGRDGSFVEQQVSDAEFIAEARADIPALLRHIAALEACPPAPALRETLARAEKAEAERDDAKGLLSLARGEHDASVLENALLEAQIIVLREAEKDHLASAASEQESMYTLRENYDSALKRAIRMEGRATRAENENVTLVEQLATKQGVIQNWMNLHDEAVERMDKAEAERDTLRAQLATLRKELAGLKGGAA